MANHKLHVEWNSPAVRSYPWVASQLDLAIWENMVNAVRYFERCQIHFHHGLSDKRWVRFQELTSDISSISFLPSRDTWSWNIPIHPTITFQQNSNHIHHNPFYPPLIHICLHNNLPFDTTHLRLLLIDNHSPSIQSPLPSHSLWSSTTPPCQMDWYENAIWRPIARLLRRWHTGHWIYPWDVLRTYAFDKSPLSPPR